MPRGCWFPPEVPAVVAAAAAVAVVVVVVAVAGRKSRSRAANRKGCSFGMLFAVVASYFVEAGRAEHQIDQIRSAGSGIRSSNHSGSQSVEAEHTDCSRSRCSGVVAAATDSHASPQLVAAGSLDYTRSAELEMAQEYRRKEMLRFVPQAGVHELILPLC